MNNDKKVVWFIRHAESEANADKNYRADNFSIPLVHLSEVGLKQAKEVLNYFSLPPDLIVTSSFLRTKQTAKPIIKKYSSVVQEEWPIQEFTFLSLDKCFGTTILERRSLVEEYWQKSDPAYWDGRGAETFIGFINRVQDTIERIKKRKEKFIILFSHGYFIAAIQYIVKKNPKNISSKEMKRFREYFLSNKVPNAGKVEFIF